MKRLLRNFCQEYVPKWIYFTNIKKGTLGSSPQAFFLGRPRPLFDGTTFRSAVLSGSCCFILSSVENSRCSLDYLTALSTSSCPSRQVIFFFGSQVSRLFFRIAQVRAFCVFEDGRLFYLPFFSCFLVRVYDA